MVAGKIVRKKQHSFADGTTYEGGWERGVFHGHGALTWGRFYFKKKKLCSHISHTGYARCFLLFSMHSAAASTTPGISIPTHHQSVYLVRMLSSAYQVLLLYWCT